MPHRSLSGAELGRGKGWLRLFRRFFRVPRPFNAGVDGPVPPIHRVLPVILLLLSGNTSQAKAAEAFESLHALVRVQGVSGREQAAGEEISRRLPSHLAVQTVNLGNQVVALGSVSPVVLLLAAMDEPGIVLTQIRDDGDLRLDRLPRLPPCPLCDQFVTGQPTQVGAGR